jgi:hypothetical protein
MHDPDRVRLGDRFADLQHQLGDFRDRQRYAMREYMREVFAFEVLHHDVGHTARQVPDVAHAHDVRALDLRRGPGLAHEALDRFVIAEPARG